MGIKLKKYQILLLCFIISSCASKRGIEYESKKAFIQAFKVSVLYGCINEATNGEFQKFSIDNNDLGLAQEVSVLYHAEADIAQNIGKELTKKIKSIDYSDYEGRKPIFSDCVNFSFSKEIDSLAKVKYKLFKKSKLSYITE